MRKTRQKKQGGVETAMKPVQLHPTEEQIRQRAYEIYLTRGSTPGNEMDDWLMAEWELKREFNP